MTNNVLVVSHDVVGPQMAGPGMRYKALATELSKHFNVRLAAPCASDPSSTHSFTSVAYVPGQWPTLVDHFAWADVAVLGCDVPLLFPEIGGVSCPLVIDGYDPHTVETLALWGATEDLAVQVERHAARLALLSKQCYLADFVICASEVQRTWWLGLLEAHGRVNPLTFGADPSLRNLVDVVPFALPSEPFPRQVLPASIPGVRDSDVVLLWGGGLWQWMDPITVISALPQVLASCPNVKLVFPGTRHPNPGMPEMPKASEAKALSDQLELTDRVVHFGDWVPREQWNGYLARSDIGLSAHLDTLESRLAFRTRILDYIWAGLPMVVTQGDAMSELVASYELGFTVEPGDVGGMAEAILRLCANRSDSNSARFDDARSAMTWSAAVRPLVGYCERPRRAHDRSSSSAMAMGVADAGSSHAAELRAEMSRLTGERDRLLSRLDDYERGRYMRLMRWMNRLWQRWRL